MIMQLKMPTVEYVVHSGKVVGWRVAPGEVITPGQSICTVAIDQVIGKRDVPKDVYFEVELVSNDRGRLHTGIIGTGQKVVPGDVMAVVTSMDHGDAGIGDTWRTAPAMRVTTRFVDDDEGDD